MKQPILVAKAGDGWHVYRQRKTAFQRGPVVYAFEGADNDGKVLDAVIPLDAPVASEFRADLLGGVTVLTTAPAARKLTAVPYFSWANRGRGEMVVWVRH